MARIREIMQNQMQLYMSNWQYSMLVTLVLALLPFTSWLAVAGVALLTLRKGWQSGAMILVPVSIVYYLVGLKSLSSMAAMVNTAAMFLPCYFGALILRFTSTWQAVVGTYFIVIAVIVLAIQMFAPDFIIAQYVYLQSILQKNQPDTPVVKILTDLASLNQSVIASYAFGIQVISVFLSGFIALVFARAMQSSLYNVGGFKQEVNSFRAHKLAIFILFVMFFAVTKQNMLAMMLLPSVIIYFLLAGLCICAGIVYKKNPKFMFGLFLPIIFVPVFAVPFYSILGLFDSLFSLRFYSFRPRKRG